MNDIIKYCFKSKGHSQRLAASGANAENRHNIIIVLDASNGFLTGVLTLIESVTCNVIPLSFFREQSKLIFPKVDLIIDKNGIKQLSNPQNTLTKFKIIPANMIVFYLNIFTRKRKLSERALLVSSKGQSISLIISKPLSLSKK